MANMDDFGEFAVLAPLLVTHDRLRGQMLAEDLVWILPDDLLAGYTAAWGIPIVRAAVGAPMLAHKLPEP